ncbi:unnamed protein product [Paramecium primaurelia]|uniref:Uncharacterized protein n=1 Tax=Paramecium primaurelia TaxID=5886 RepID=A0A8S1JQF1_PARPR|nr:unnamed protein product [Paramecium primaurelia]
MLQSKCDELYPQYIPQSFQDKLLQHHFAPNLTFQEVIQNLMSEDFIKIHNGLISYKNQLMDVIQIENDIEDQQITLLITILQQILQAQMPPCIQFYAINNLCQLLIRTNIQHQLQIKQISFESLCQIYNRDSPNPFQFQILNIFSIFCQLDKTIAYQIFKLCHIQQKLDQIKQLIDVIHYLQALQIFCKQMPQCYKNMTLNFIKKQFIFIQKPSIRACKIAIQIINDLVSIENPELDQQLLNIWDEIIIIWLNDNLNELEGSMIQIISKFIKKANFPKEKIKNKVFLDRLFHNLQGDQIFNLIDSLQIYQFLIKQFQICIADDEFFQKLMQLCKNSLNPNITSIILQIIIQMLKSKQLSKEYLSKLQQFNIIRLLPEYLHEAMILIEKINYSTQLSGFLKQKQINELTLVNCIMKIVTLILKQNILIDKFKTEIAQFERMFQSEKFQTFMHNISVMKIQEKFTLIKGLLQSIISYEDYESSDNKKIRID